MMLMLMSFSGFYKFYLNPEDLYKEIITRNPKKVGSSG